MYGLGLAYPSIDAAIQQFEGYAPGTPAYINNNPGNLQYASWEAAYGCAPGGSGGFAVCQSYSAGQEIEDHLVSSYVDQGDSLSQLLASWSPPSAPGNSQAAYDNYLASVASSTGLDASVPISQQLSDSGAGSSDATSDTSGLDLSSILGTGDDTLLWAGLALAAGLVLVFAIS